MATRSIECFREPLDVTVTSRRKGTRSWRACVVVCEPGAGAPSPRPRRTAPPTDRWEVRTVSLNGRPLAERVDANTASEARAVVKAKLGVRRLEPGSEVRWVKQLRERARRA